MINWLLWFFGIKQRPSRKNLIAEISDLTDRCKCLRETCRHHEETISVLRQHVTELLFPPKRKRGRPKKVVA